MDVKRDSALIVDANAVLASAVALQGFEPGARPAKVSERGCGIELPSLFSADRSKPENALTRLPEIKSLVRLPR